MTEIILLYTKMIMKELSTLFSSNPNIMTDKEILLAVITGVTANPEYAQFSDETIANKAINISNILTEKINENSCDKPRRHGKVLERDRRVSE